VEKVRVTVIGAGIVGLAIASALAERYDGVYILEKNWKAGLEGSTHNSGVIHSGIHYPPGSLKAKLCVKGNRMIYDICSRNGVDFRRTGKLTAASWEQESVIEKLRHQGEENGVPGLEILDSKEISEIEPLVKADIALFTPTSGIVDQSQLLDHFYSKFMRSGGTLVTDSRVDSVRKRGNFYEVSGVSRGGRFSFLSGAVINSAGLYAEHIARAAGIDVDSNGYRTEYWKGDYYRIEGDLAISTLVYPVPEDKGLGIHLTPDTTGSLRLGPNSYRVDEINFNVETDQEQFMTEAEKYIPSIRSYRLSPDFAGIRTKIKGNGFRDFVIREETENGLEGFINLIGIESPGLTASPAIAELVLEMYSSIVDR